MYRIMIVLGMLTLAGASCHKSEKNSGESPTHPVTGVSGKWMYVSYAYSIGGPLEWHPVSPSGTWIQFADGGRFQTNNAGFVTYSSYNLIDSVRVKLGDGAVYPAGNARIYLYHFDPATGFLDLSPMTPMCTEGCVDRFIRYPTN